MKSTIKNILKFIFKPLDIINNNEHIVNVNFNNIMNFDINNNEKIICVHINENLYEYLIKNKNVAFVLANRLAIHCNNNKLVILTIEDNINIYNIWRELPRLASVCKYVIAYKTSDYKIIDNIHIPYTGNEKLTYIARHQFHNIINRCINNG